MKLELLSLCTTKGITLIISAIILVGMVAIAVICSKGKTYSRYL